MGMKQAAKMSGEEYVKGRRAGVEGTEGQSRSKLAEKTIPDSDKHDADSGSRQSDLCSAAKSLYSRAVGPGEDPSKMGDQAMRVR